MCSCTWILLIYFNMLIYLFIKFVALKVVCVYVCVCVYEWICVNISLSIHGVYMECVKLTNLEHQGYDWVEKSKVNSNSWLNEKTNLISETRTFSLTVDRYRRVQKGDSPEMAKCELQVRQINNVDVLLVVHAIWVSHHLWKQKFNDV